MLCACGVKRAAVHMVHAHAELTGQLGVAVLLIGVCISRAQANMGALQDFPHTEIMRPVARYAKTARVADQALCELHEALARACGDLGEPGPVYIEFPTDVRRTRLHENLVLEDWMTTLRLRRLRLWPQCDGNRYRSASCCEGGICRIE